MLKVCEICGKEFEAFHNKKCCSPECSKQKARLYCAQYQKTHREKISAYQRKYRAKVRKPKEKVLKVCPICGKEFEALHNKKYCSPECRHKSKNQYNRDRYWEIRGNEIAAKVRKPKVEKIPSGFYKCRCAVCGKEMLRRTPNAIYCSNECSVKDGGKTPFKLTTKQKRQCEELKMQLAIRRLDFTEI